MDTLFVGVMSLYGTYLLVEFFRRYPEWKRTRFEGFEEPRPPAAPVEEQPEMVEVVETAEIEEIAESLVEQEVEVDAATEVEDAAQVPVEKLSSKRLRDLCVEFNAEVGRGHNRFIKNARRLKKATAILALRERGILYDTN